MIVNVNPCASTYDETLHAAKFSALASQVRSYTHNGYIFFGLASFTIVLAVLELSTL